MNPWDWLNNDFPIEGDIMEYSMGIYEFPTAMADKVRMDDLLNRMSNDRWTVKWIGTSYRGTKLIVLFERMIIR